MDMYNAPFFLFFFPISPSFLRLVLYHSRSFHVLNVIPPLMFFYVSLEDVVVEKSLVLHQRPSSGCVSTTIRPCTSLLFCYAETIALRSPLTFHELY